MLYKYLWCSLFFCLFYDAGNAQAPLIQWQKHFGGTALDHAKWIEQTSDSGYIIAGYTRSSDGDITYNHGMAAQQDAWVLKLDQQGKLVWQRTYGGSLDDEFTSIRQTADGGFIAAGFTRSTDGDVTANHGKTDCWLVKLDASGTISWLKTYGGTADEATYAVEATTDQGYIIAGYTSSTDGDVTRNHGGKDYWVIKTDNIGQLTWQKCYGNSGDNTANSIIPSREGGYLIAGVSDCVAGDTTMANQHGNTDCWVIKTDAGGQVEWQRAYGGSAMEVAKSITQAADSTYIITGQTGSSDGDVSGFHGPAGLDIWTFCLERNGTLKWQKAMGGSGLEGSRSVRTCRDGGYIIGGSASSNDGDLVNNNRTAADFWLIKLNQAGNIEWSKTTGNTGEDNSSNALQTMDDGYIMAGDISAVSHDPSCTWGGDDLGVVKFSYKQSPVQADCGNIRIFPNPCNHWLRINLPVGYEAAHICIRNLTGTTILTDNRTGLFRELERGTATTGLYFLTVYNTGMPPCTTRIILQ